MIKLEIEGKEKPADRTVRFSFKRHQALPDKQIAYLRGQWVNDPTALGLLYPVKIDGEAKVITIRRTQAEALGFRVEIE